jgi:putative oxidoreductase
VPGWLDALDRRITRFLATYSITILRIALGIVFIWFGGLKIAGESPVEDLVREMLWWAPQENVVLGLGIFEVIVGASLLTAFALRLILLLFWAQLVGTFLVLVLRPDIAFQDPSNPLLLTVEGEFVVKNLVLIAGGLVVGSTVKRRRA